MIKSFKDKKTSKLFAGEYVKEFQQIIKQSIRRLQILDNAVSLTDLKQLPSNHFEALKGDRKGQYSIHINKQWRICFQWHRNNAYEVEITDYH